MKKLVMVVVAVLAAVCVMADEPQRGPRRHRGERNGERRANFDRPMPPPMMMHGSSGMILRMLSSKMGLERIGVSDEAEGKKIVEALKPVKEESDALESNTATAAQIIDGFVRSPEFINRNLSDADSVDILYKTMLSREADEGGKAGWVQVLAQGNSYATVINGFCGSEEFATLCNEYGITPGSITLMSGFYIGEAACLNEEKVTAFVQQNYSAVLGRDADEQGLEDYTRALMNYLETPQQVIHDFIFSPEYQEQLPGNEAFITTLYQAYLGREPDPEGLAGWVQKLEDGTSLEEIVNGFAGSAEFKTIVNSMKE